MSAKRSCRLILSCSLLVLLLPLVVVPQATSKNQAQVAASPTPERRLNQKTKVPSSNESNLATEESWKRLIDEAADLYYSEPEKSLATYVSAREVAVQLNDKRLLALTLYYAGRAYSGTGDLEKAEASYLNSRAAFDEAGVKKDVVYVLSDLGELYLYSGDHVKAKRYAEQSIALAEEFRSKESITSDTSVQCGYASALATLGNISKSEGNYTQAVDHFEKSLAIYEKLNSNFQYYGDISDCLANIGRVHRVAGDNVKALLYLNKALGIAEKSEDKIRVAGVANSIGILYLEQGDFVKADVYLEKSLQLYEAEKDYVEVAKVLTNLGVSNQKQGKHEQALGKFRESLNLAEVSHYKEVELLAYQGIGSVLADQSSYTAALTNFDKGLQIAEEVNDRTRRAELLWRQAEVYSAIGGLPQSIALASEAANLAEQLRLPIISYLSLTTKGKAQLAKGEYEPARETLTQAVKYVEEMRGQVVGREQEQQLFFEKRTDAYYSLVELLVKQGKFEEALAHAELAKGRVLLDMLRGDKGKEAALTPNERTDVQRLNAKLVNINTQLKSAGAKRQSDAQEIATLEKRLQTARLEQEEFESSLSATHPGQHKSKAASLREAALKLMHEPKYKHPFYWASFVLVGSSR